MRFLSATPSCTWRRRRRLPQETRRSSQFWEGRTQPRCRSFGRTRSTWSPTIRSNPPSSASTPRTLSARSPTWDLSPHTTPSTSLTRRCWGGSRARTSTMTRLKRCRPFRVCASRWIPWRRPACQTARPPPAVLVPAERTLATRGRTVVSSRASRTATRTTRSRATRSGSTMVACAPLRSSRSSPPIRSSRSSQPSPCRHS
mmetsp:Transcript_41424/g.118489  ORF Transcript_41424/g.118489 Transcript_41424/m.118489 type:complete len:201 (-) Transcript_41424:976-1578(-)